jgi:hypothetical protein
MVIAFMDAFRGRKIDIIPWQQQAASDKALGGAMLLTALIVFVYYTVWAILLVRIFLP